MNNLINVFNDTNFKLLPKKKVKNTINQILINNNIENSIINIIFVDEKTIIDLNVKFLEHNYITDVISFTIESQPLEGEVYICVEQAKLQADDYNVSLANELIRLSIHGVLHLLGFDDDTDEKRNNMHNIENTYLQLEKVIN